MPTLGLPPDPPLKAWPTRGPTAILDLEYTAWEGSAARNWTEAWEWREIVQIGCVIVDSGNAFAVRDELEIVVRPERNPVLSDYFTALTGIEQARLEDEGVALPSALSRLAKFAAMSEHVIFNGFDGEVLRENCVLHGMSPPWSPERMLDFRPLLASTLGRSPRELVSSGLPALAGIASEGPSHSALHDCRAITAAFAAWRDAGTL